MSTVIKCLSTKKEIRINLNSSLVLGRNDDTGCTDKRVSRRHGLLFLSSSSALTIEALHTNPCFVMRGGKPPVIIVNKNDKENIENGDLIALLPDSTWFQVMQTTGEPESTEKVAEGLLDKLEAGDEVVSTAVNGDEDGVPAKRRRLPSWMLNESYSTSASTSTQEGGTTSCEETSGTTPASPVLSLLNPPQDLLHSSSSKNLEIENSCHGTSRPVSPSTSPLPTEFDRIFNTATPSPTLLPPCKDEPSLNNSESCCQEEVTASTAVDETPNSDNHSEVKIEIIENEIVGGSSSHTSDQVTIKTEISSTQSISSITNGTPSSDLHTVNPQSPAAADSAPNQMTPPLNPPVAGRSNCQYGSACYRRNLTHRADFAHPGDADWVPPDQRPVCQYGAACYRRNPSHRANYSHPVVIIAALPIRRMPSSPSSDASFFLDSDEDPFHTDGDDDSDYNPHISSPEE